MTVQLKTSSIALQQLRRVDAIKASAAKRYGYKPEEIDSTRKPRQLALARHVAMWAVRKLITSPDVGNRRKPIPFQNISTLFARTDHNSAMFAFNKVEELRTSDVNFRVLTADVLKEFGVPPI